MLIPKAEFEMKDSKSGKILRPIPRWKSRIVGLGVTIVAPAIIGALIGWFHPNKPPTTNGGIPTVIPLSIEN